MNVSIWWYKDNHNGKPEKEKIILFKEFFFKNSFENLSGELLTQQVLSSGWSGDSFVENNFIVISFTRISRKVN